MSSLMYCVISLENLNRLIITKKDDGFVKYMNIIAPIRLNFVQKNPKNNTFFFLEQILLTDFLLWLCGSQHSPICWEIPDYNEIAASVLSNRCLHTAQVDELSLLNLMCFQHENGKFPITFTIILKIQGLSCQTDD